MKTLIVALIAVFSAGILQAQTRIGGIVNNEKGMPLANVNIMIARSYDGTSSDSSGHFTFSTTGTGKHVLLFSSMNYRADSVVIYLNGQSLDLHLTLKEKLSELNTVTITAGSFEAGNSKGAVLSSLDIATTAGATADIFAALQTLPGTQASFSESGLFVRGGSASETKTFFDGMLVKNPFSTTVPDQASRGRFSPFLFKGTSFSAGGYSAQYGQALSSALLLESKDLPEKSTTAISLLSVGLSADQVIRFEKSALTAGGFYYNLKPAFSIIKQRTNWQKAPEQFGGTLQYKLKTSENGILKWYSEISRSLIGAFTTNPDDPAVENYFKNDNQNSYINTSYQDYLSGKWKLQGGLAYSNNTDAGENNSDLYVRTDRLIHGRITASNYFGTLSTLKIGGEMFAFKRKEGLNLLSRHYSDQLSSVFAETDLFLSHRWVARFGIRGEYSSYLHKFNLSPRTSLSYKTGRSSQLSLAYGRFYQNPDDEFLIIKPLDFEQADHILANFQKISSMQVFRIEAYYKRYRNLTKSNGLAFDNSGSGYAKGVDIFWRDKQTFKGVNYWISYSYLDTRRDFRDYPRASIPPFAAKHTFNVVYKQFFEKLNTQVAGTYTFASGRTYINPNSPVYLSDKTKNYNNFSVNVSYLTHIFKQFTVLYLSANNIPGFKNIYGYHYAANGQSRQAVEPAAPRDFFIGLLMTIGDDTFVR